MTRLDLSDLEALAAVAGARGFRRAGALSGQSPSALSEAVRRLEARLDTRLLNRTTRSVTPTEAGQRLLDRLIPALADIAGAVEVAVDNRFVDVLAEGFDAGIRYDEAVDRDMIAIPIGPREQRMVTAAAPAYWNRAGRPRHPDDLARHRLIRFRFASGVMPPWEFARGAERRRVNEPPAMVAGSSALQIAAAEAGLGVLHMFEGFVAPAIAAGRLEEVLGAWSDRFPGPVLYFPSRRQMPPGLRRFVDFVKEWRS